MIRKIEIKLPALLAFVLIFIVSSFSGMLTSAEEDELDNQVFLPLSFNGSVQFNSDGSWPMAGANPERTSWTSSEAAGSLEPLWYRPIEPYISLKVQVIADHNLLYISTANGLYAFDPDNGAEEWVYPTEMPLGHSPTISNEVAYVGGLDKKIHAVNALTGAPLWAFEAGGGFQSNPLVVNNTVYIGSRDGYFYAVDSVAGTLKWKYKTDGPILFSAAYKDGVIYFASNDSYAYALNASNGSLVWKSAKLPGSGFHSFWPVVYEDRVLFTVSPNYRNIDPGNEDVKDKDILYPHRAQDPMGTLIGPLGNQPGDWVAGTPTIDMSQPEVTPNGSTFPLTEFLETHPWRRTLIILNRSDGKEVTYDFDQDGIPEYAPILSHAGKATQFFPPVVGSDNVIYMQNGYMSSPSIPGGHISGWQMDTPYISVISSDWGAWDEPHVASAGGDLIYWNLCCDRSAGSMDISKPNNLFQDRYMSGKRPATGPRDTSREYGFFGYHLYEDIPGYNVMTYVWNPPVSTYGGVYGGKNGAYGWHHDGNPPIPYQGKVYLIASNALVAFGPDNGAPVQLPLAEKREASNTNPPVTNVEVLKERLASEIQKMVAAGHLLPGYVTGAGQFDLRGSDNCGDDLVDYWHHPAETIYTLLRALPYLPEDLKVSTRAYIQSEFNAYPPYKYNHIGWVDGAPRDIYNLPEDVLPEFGQAPAELQINNFVGWKFNPFAFYALWMYAEEFGNAAAILQSAKNSSNLMESFSTIPQPDILAEMPFVHNAYIAGYMGYIELAKLANSGEDLSGKQDTLNGLLASRAATFSNESPERFFVEGPNYFYCRALNVSRNYMFLVPELGAYLHDNAIDKVQPALAEAQYVAPHWFVSKAEVAFGEGARQHLYDYHSIFQAKAFILKESYTELSKYIDVPAVPIGDLYYIDNLITAISLSP